MATKKTSAKKSAKRTTAKRAAKPRVKRTASNHLPTLIATLENVGACYESLAWLRSLPAKTTPEQAYAQCERGDWLVWLAGKVQIDRKTLVLIACACAEPALRFIPETEQRPRKAIEVTRAWTEGRATIEKVQTAREGALTARRELYAAAAAAAAAAADAAYAADAYAAYAAYAAAAYAADAAATAAILMTAAARLKARAEQAGFVRSLLQWSVLAEKLEALHARS